MFQQPWSPFIRHFAASEHLWQRSYIIGNGFYPFSERIFRVQGIFQLLQSMILEENFMESEYRGIGDGLNKKSTSAI